MKKNFKLLLQNNRLIKTILICSCRVAFFPTRTVTWKCYVKTISNAAIKSDAQTEILTELQTQTAFLCSDMFCFYKLHVSSVIYELVRDKKKKKYSTMLKRWMYN